MQPFGGGVLDNIIMEMKCFIVVEESHKVGQVRGLVLLSFPHSQQPISGNKNEEIGVGLII